MTDAIPKFEWICPRYGCKRIIMTYTSEGQISLVREHMKQHAREDQDNQLASEQIVEFKAESKNYDILEITLIDIGFLKTRCIALDGNIVLDLTHEPQPAKTELYQKQWAKILNAAWELIPPGDSNAGT